MATFMALGVFSAALWMFANPYIGIDHDARLYTLMAMRWLAPAAYAKDPWFAFGSQDDWSLFSPLYAQLLVVFDVPHGALVMTVMSAVLYVVAAIALSRAMLRGSIAALAALCLVGVPLNYSTEGMLNVSEAFATARMPAVALSMLALASAIKGRPVWALVLHVLALLLHPTMAIGPALVTLVSASKAAYRVRWIVMGGVIVLLLFLLGVTNRISMLEGAWLTYVSPAPLVFIRSWVFPQLSMLLTSWAVLLVAGRWGGGRWRVAYVVAALVSFGGVLVSLFAGEYAPVTLVMQAQLWRSLWISQVLAVVAAVDLMARYVLRRRAGGRAAWALSAAVMAAVVPPYIVLTSLYGAARAMSRRARENALNWVGKNSILLWWVAVILLCIAAPGYLQNMALRASAIGVWNAWPDMLVGWLRVGGFGLLPLVCWLVVRKCPPVLALILSIVLLSAALTGWDIRTATQRAWESRYRVDASQRHFSSWIRRGHTVYWHDAAPRVWLELGTSGYASTTHATGLVFSRERTLLLASRMYFVALRTLQEDQYQRYNSVSAVLNLAQGRSPDERNNQWMVLARYETMHASTRFGIERMCSDSALDYVIDPQGFEGLFVASERDDVGLRTQRVYLYECARLRQRQLDVH